MKNTKIEACPISYTQVDKHLVKLYSSVVLLVLILSLFLKCKIGIYLITADFIIRVFIGIKYSPLCFSLKRMLHISTLKPVMINAGAKKIAAQVGLLFSILISISYLLGYIILAKIFTVFFLTAISVDLIFDYCLACKMQSIYLNYFKNRK